MCKKNKKDKTLFIYEERNKLKKNLINGGIICSEDLQL